MGKAPQAMQGHGDKLRVLLAEDNPVNQTLAVRLIEKGGHTVTVASDGHEALVALENGDFDVLLMDVQMPRLDGLEATALIRKKEEGTGRHLPIIALTAHAMQGDRERCLAAGMDDYLSKPVQARELAMTLEGIVGRKSAHHPNAAKSAPVFDRAEALSRVEGDETLLAELAQLFLKDSSGRLAEIRNSLERGDAAGLERAAHSLKGSVSNFGARRAFDAAAELEKTARRGDLSECKRLCTLLEAEVDTLRPELERVTIANANAVGSHNGGALS
jgi:CheY-like chemotaxis protein